MIDWYNLWMNALWIFACALALATLSYTSWQAAVLGQKFGAQLSQPGPQAALNLAGMLFCAGLAGTSTVVWQQVVWVLLGVGFAAQIGVAWYQQRK